MKNENLIVRSGEKEYAIVVAPDGAPGTIQIDGAGCSFEFKRISPEVISLLLDGSSYLFTVSSNGGGEYRVGWSGGEALVEVEDERARILKKLLDPRSGAKARKNIRAPMPGLVVKLLVKVGDEVKKGDPLMVVEAMKMENEITAHTSGKITEIKVAEKQAVEKNELLMVIG